MFGAARLLELAGNITWPHLVGAGWRRRDPKRKPFRRRALDLEELEARIVPTLLGQQLFPADYPWNQNIQSAPVAANSAAIIAHIGSAIKIHPDWGDDSSSNGNAPLYGIPFNVVHGNAAGVTKVNVIIDDYPGESDIVPVPIPPGAVIEGDYQNGPNPNGPGYNANQRGDSHLIVWDEDNNIAYELFGAARPSDPVTMDGVPTGGQWHAAQESVWNMKTDSFRSLGATSADAAGLSILAGLARPDEGLPTAQGGQGAINHALRFTLPSGDVSPQYIYPASHVVSVSSGTTKLPFGARLRLMNTPAVNAVISTLQPEAQIVARAMQQYGLVLADIGTAMYVTGTSASQDANNNINFTWNMNDVLGLAALTASDFQVIDLTPRVTGLSASGGLAGSTLTITGQNFSGTAGHLTVLFGTAPATAVTYVDDAHLTAVVPGGAGTVPVQVQSGVNATDPNNPNDNVTNPIFGYGTSATLNAPSFTYSALVTPLPFTDQFNRPDSGSLGASWSVLSGSISIQANAGHVASPYALALVNGVTRADVTVGVDATLPAIGAQVGLVARQSGPGDTNEYLARLYRTATGYLAQIYRFTNGAATKLAETDVTGFAGVGTTTTIQLTMLGTSLKLYVGSNLTLAAFANDSSIQSGALGVRGTVGTTIDNFSASDVPTASPTLPFSDNFSTTSQSNQLDASWQDRSGNFSVQNGMAQGTLAAGSANVSVLSGAVWTDVAVSADVNVAIGQKAGLVARYQGSNNPSDSNYYLALLNNASGAPLAQLYAIFGGNVYLLAQANASGSAGNLRLQVVGGSLQFLLGGTLQVSCVDYRLVAGSVGMRASATTFDNFMVTAAASVLPFNDAFATGNVLSSSWLADLGSFSVAGGAANGQTAANIASLAGVNATDVIVAASVNIALGQQAGLIARHTALGNSNYYLGRIDHRTSTPMAQIISNVGGLATIIAQAPATGTAGALQFEVVGNSLRLFLGTTLQVFGTDTNLASGTVGMLGSVTALDNFSANLYAPTTASLPFSDSFGASNTQGQLASTWATRVGDITVAGGVASGKGPINIAVLGGVSIANATVTVDVAPASGQEAGLLANYNGVGDNSMYVALLDNTTGSPVAQIIRIAANGQRTLLGKAAAQAGSGTLRFQVAGNSLQLSLNGTVLVDAIDVNPLAAGSVGIRGSATTFANFTATSP